ncbi:MAG TPA: hypothetical protein VMW56_13780 [Candidatus Margulisiibacteriota bacterium]|nr:hypothetical protein [Candidatus Margulisiibacteriota bacterium]
MKQHPASIVGLAMLAIMVASVPAAAQHLSSGAGVPQPMLLRISGFVGGAPRGTLSLGTFTFGFDDRVIALDLSGVQTLNGPLTEGPAALRQFDLYSPNLLLVGDPDILRKLADAAPHAQITLFGYLHQGARRMFVVQVDAA